MSRYPTVSASRSCPGNWLPEKGSLREWGATIGVNPNTVARSYDMLTETGVIYQKRGIGFFVCEDAREKILASERRRFIEEELPATIKRAQLLGIDLKEYI